MRARWCWILLCCANAWAEPPTRLQPEIGIDGRRLRLDVSMQAGVDGILSADVDLTPILAELRASIVRRLPRDACRRHGLDNWVARLRRFGAWVDGKDLWLETELDVEAWGCAELRGSELRRKLADGGVRLRLPLRVEARDGSLRLRVGEPDAGLRGRLGEAARWYFALHGEEFGAALARRARELDARQLALPAATAWFGKGELRGAQFVDAGRPTLRLAVAWSPALPGWMHHVWPW